MKKNLLGLSLIELLNNLVVLEILLFYREMIDDLSKRSLDLRKTEKESVIWEIDNLKKMITSSLIIDKVNARMKFWTKFEEYTEEFKKTDFKNISPFMLSWNIEVVISLLNLLWPDSRFIELLFHLDALETHIADKTADEHREKINHLFDEISDIEDLFTFAMHKKFLVIRDCLLPMKLGGLPSKNKVLMIRTLLVDFISKMS